MHAVVPWLAMFLGWILPKATLNIRLRGSRCNIEIVSMIEHLLFQLTANPSESIARRTIVIETGTTDERLSQIERFVERALAGDIVELATQVLKSNRRVASTVKSIEETLGLNPESRV